MNAIVSSAQLGSNPWGECTVTLRIAGNHYRIEGLSASQLEVVLNRYSAAVVDPDNDALNMTLYQASAASLALKPPLDEDAVVKSYARADLVEVVGVHFYAALSLKPGLEGKIWTDQEAGTDFRLSFENFFRLVVAYKVLNGGGLLLHSAGVMERGHADVFVGCSGFGKSTISELRQSEGATVLSDDMVALKMIDGRLHALAVPFTGDLDTWSQLDSCYPVRALIHLQKGPDNQLSNALTVAQTASNLMVCAPYVNADSYLVDGLLDCTLRMGEALPMRCLTFAPKPGLGQFLDASLS